MASPVLWEIDPTSEDAANVPLALTTAPLKLLGDDAMDLTPPDIDPIYATSADTEGDPFVGSRYRNRVIRLTLLARDTTDALTQTAVYGVQQKVEKLRRERGTLKYTTAAGTVIVFDVVRANFKPEFSAEFYMLNRAVKFDLEFECKPHGRGAATLLSDHTETTLPALIFTESSLAGDVWGLGKLVIDDDQAQDRWWVIWGLRSRYEGSDGATTAALFYEAESRTPQGAASVVTGPSGASGGGTNNVIQTTTVGSQWQSVMSTQASGGGAHLSHIGDYRVFARVQYPTTNAGSLYMALEWSQGDFRTFTRNTAVQVSTTVPFGTVFGGGVWRWMDLGMVQLEKTTGGTQQWEGRILAKSTTSADDLNIDCLAFIPVTEGSGELVIMPQIQTPTVFGGRDEFEQAPANLNGLTAPTGGTWATSGGATDIATLVSPIAAGRSTTDGSTRYAVLGATTYTTCAAAIDIRWPTHASQTSGLLLRWTDVNNYLGVVVQEGSTTGPFYLTISKVVSGTASNITIGFNPPMSIGDYHTLMAQVDASGRVAAWLMYQGQQPSTPFVVVQDAVLATGGTLASGKVGFVDSASTGAGTRVYDNFGAWTPTVDAAIFASQSMEIRSDRVVREDSAGTLLVRRQDYEGDYLKVPPAGKEGRTCRFIVLASRNQPNVMPDPGIDDISARLTYTPRYLVLPS